MTIQTLEADRKNLVSLVERLPDKLVLQAKEYIERINNEEMHLRRIDGKLDEAEKIAADPNAVWIDEKEFWAGNENLV